MKILVLGALGMLGHKLCQHRRRVRRALRARADPTPGNRPDDRHLDALMKYRQHAGQRIGPVTRRVPSSAYREALKRENPYAELITVAEAVRQRLLAHRSEFNTRNVVADLEDLIGHLGARSMLPHARWQRIGPLMRELASLRYHHYSNGLSSAAKDLFLRGPTTQRGQRDSFASKRARMKLSMERNG